MLTGQIGNDGQKVTSNSETSGRFHTDWLSMMYPRLKVARNLLRMDGVIFISIDDRELANLKVICGEIFGEENFIGTVVWKGATDNNPTQIVMEHEYLLCYSRNREFVEDTWKNRSDDSKQILLQEFERLRCDTSLSEKGVQLKIRAFIRTNREALAAVTHYDRVDSEGLYTGSRKVHNPKPGGYRYDIIHPKTGKVCIPPVNGYRYPEETMKQLLTENRIIFGDDETQIIQIKEYLKDYEGKFASVIQLDSRTGANEINKLFGIQKLFTNPKPVALLTSIFDFVAKPGDTVMDFFAGSGSTAHALMEMNAQDEGSRKCILVQLPEPLDPSHKDQKVAVDFCDHIGKPRNIAELTKERLRRAGKRILEQNRNFAGDVGFRLFKLASSNIHAWEPDGNQLEDSLLRHTEHLVSGRTEQDVLYELLLKLGLDLCVPIETRTIAGKTVHSIGAGALIACLADGITRQFFEELATGIVEWHKELAPAVDTRVVFKDSGFADDVAKTNMAAILNQNGILDVRSL